MFSTASPQLFFGLLVVLPFTKAALNIGLANVDPAIKAKLNLVRNLIYVDKQHLEPSRTNTKVDLESRSHCRSSDGPCLMMQRKDSAVVSDYSEDPQDLEVNGVLPLRFLGRNAIEKDRWQREFLDSVVAAEGDEVTLHDQLRTMDQIKRPRFYKKQEPYPPFGGDHYSFEPAALERIALGSPISYVELRRNSWSHSNIDVSGVGSTWEGAWQRGPGPSAQLLGGLGYIRFNQRILISSLPMRPCGGIPAQKVLVVGRQGLSTAWEHVVSLSECTTSTDWYDLMEVNATLLSIDEIMIVSILGRDVCFSSLQTITYPEKLEITGESRVQRPAHLDGGEEDVHHEVLLLYPGSVTQRYMWNFQPIRVSSSALSRLVSISDAHKAGLSLKTLSESTYQCLQKSQPSETEASRLGMLLLHGDNPRYTYEPPRPPEFSNSSRKQLLNALDSILRTPSGILGVWARDLTHHATTARASLLSCQWHLGDEQTCGIVPEAVAKEERKALDALIAALFQVKQLQPEHLWKLCDTAVSSQYEVLEEISLHEPSSMLPKPSSAEDGCAINQVGVQCVTKGKVEMELLIDAAAEDNVSSGWAALFEALIVFSCIASSGVFLYLMRSRRRATHAGLRSHKPAQ